MQVQQRPVRVVTDSAADIPAELARELGITVIPLHVHMGSKTYLDGVDLSGPEFYRELEATRSVTTTSLPSLESFSEAYRSLTRDGYGVVSVHLSSKLSGTFNAALMASTADGVVSDLVCVAGWVAGRVGCNRRRPPSKTPVPARPKTAGSSLSRAICPPTPSSPRCFTQLSAPHPWVRIYL